MTVINAINNTVVATIPVGLQPQGIDVHPDGSTVYVANRDSNSISVINTNSNTVIDTIAVGTAPRAVGDFIGPMPGVLSAGLGGTAIKQKLGVSVCNNLSSDQTVVILLGGTGTSWDCEDAGLLVNMGDIIRTIMIGIAD